MQILELRVNSSSSMILTQKLTHRSIRNLYQGLNPQGMLYMNTTDKTDIVVVEKITDGTVIIAAYAGNEIQKWSIETFQPDALARKLVKQFGLLCENGINDRLFD